MKIHILKVSLFLLALSTVAISADAQRTSRRRAADSGNTQTQQQNNNNTQPSGYNPYGNVPIEKESSEGGYNDSVVKKSLRNDNAFDKSDINDRMPLAYEHLRWDDALFAEKVWRELDLREKMNMPFRYDAEDDNGSTVFINMLLKAVRRDSITAFADERFTTPLTAAELASLTAGGAPDTTPVMDPNDINKVVKYVVSQKAFDPKEVTKIRIKEEWVFDREASRMFVRILGIAPVKTLYLPNGQERGSQVMFWVYYPDLRPMLAKNEVYNPKNMGMHRMTWEELFEARMFSSYIVKSTIDNPANRTIRQLVTDPILRLLEGENVKERIFNYEQDLWSY